MADTASLIARVKTEGAQQATRQLDSFSSSAASADSSTSNLANSTRDAGRASSEASGGLKRFSGAVGNSAAQVQDMIVQISGGSNAFTVLGQQGSQLASAFGPGGAVFGAIIALSAAVGGYLYNSLGEATVNTKDLEAAQKQLKDTFQQTTSGTLELTDGMIQLTQISKEAAETQLALAKANAELISQQTAKAVQEDAKSWETWKASTSAAISQYDSLIAKGADVNATLDNLSGTYEGNIVGVNMLAQNIAELSDKFGVNQQQALDMIAAQSEFNKQPTAENARKISDIFTDWLGNTKKLNPELIRLSTNANNNATALESAEKAASAAADTQKKLGDNVSITSQRLREQNDAIVKNQQIAILGDKERVRAQAAADKEAFAKREGVTKDQIAVYNAARDEEARQDVARIEKTEAAKNECIAQASQKLADAQAKRDETAAQRQQKQADDFLNTLQRQNQDELAAIDAQEQQKLEKLQSFRDNETITQQQFEDAKTQIALDADAKRNELLQKQTEDRMKQQNSADSFIEQLRAQNEGELAEIDRQYAIKQQKLDEFHKKGLVSEEDYQNAKAELQKQKNQDSLEMDLQTWDKIAGNIASASKEGTALYKAASITQAVISTYLGATKALAEGGPILGPILAATTVALGMANVAKIRSAREQGGQLSYGQVSTIAERGKPEVIMPAGASRVRTAEQMRQIMGDSNKNNGIPQISIINQTTGRIDSVQQEQDDEGRITLLIREVVSGDLQDSNSRITKSRRATRGQPGFA